MLLHMYVCYVFVCLCVRCSSNIVILFFLPQVKRKQVISDLNRKRFSEGSVKSLEYIVLFVQANFEIFYRLPQPLRSAFRCVVHS